MRAKSVNQVTGEPRLMDTAQLQAYVGLGRNGAMQFAEEIGAKVKFGKRTLWDRKRIDQYLDKLTEAE